MLFYLAFGVPGALAYRALNTADTMLGYRDGALEHFGKLAARLDDLANLVPAPLAALTIVLAAARRAAPAWSVMTRDHHHTASPNAGWTMSATAGALDVTLEKPGAYRLGHGRPPGPADIESAIRLVARATAIAVAVAVVVRVRHDGHGVAVIREQGDDGGHAWPDERSEAREHPDHAI